MAEKIDSVRAHIDKLVAFLTINSKLSQGHMVDYFTHSLYINCMPVQLQAEISHFGFEETINHLLNTDLNDIQLNNKGASLKKFIYEARSFSLYSFKDICISRTDFCNILGIENKIAPKVNILMSMKKCHEVEMLSIIANNIAIVANTSHLVDIGDGKGYLSSSIASEYRLLILGVDGSAFKENTTTRVNKQSKHRERNEERQILYKHITQLVSEKTDFDALIKDAFLENAAGIGLIGLHTCGNLGPASLRIFNENPNIKSILNVSCCYHLLNEDYLANTSMGSLAEQTNGLPMSAHLQNQKFSLPRATRMLAAHSLDRILQKRELPSKSLFYRALLQILLEEKQLQDKHVGRFRRQPQTFIEYARQAGVKLSVSFKQTDEELRMLYAQYAHRRAELMAFSLVRSMLAPAIEALILLDRYLYLLERGYENVHLVQLFDPIISPRCYGLVCIKNKD